MEEVSDKLEEERQQSPFANGEEKKGRKPVWLRERGRERERGIPDAEAIEKGMNRWYGDKVTGSLIWEPSRRENVIWFPKFIPMLYGTSGEKAALPSIVSASPLSSRVFPWAALEVSVTAR